MGLDLYWRMFVMINTKINAMAKAEYLLPTHASRSGAKEGMGMP